MIQLYLAGSKLTFNNMSFHLLPDGTYTYPSSFIQDFTDKLLSLQSSRIINCFHNLGTNTGKQAQ